jgi:hypothetical protein
MLKKYISISILTLFAMNLIYAGCGSCNVHKKKATTETSQYEHIGTVPENGIVKGFVLASCSMCNFDSKDKKECSLGIKIGETTYDVKGTTISDHGDMHAADGFCSTVRTASVLGKVMDDIIIVESFELQK